MAASARRGLIDFAISMGRVPASTDCLLPSGRVISMLLIRIFQRNTQAACVSRPYLLSDDELHAIAFLAVSGNMEFHGAVVGNRRELHFHQVHAYISRRQGG